MLPTSTNSATFGLGLLGRLTVNFSHRIDGVNEQPWTHTPLKLEPQPVISLGVSVIGPNPHVLSLSLLRLYCRFHQNLNRAKSDAHAAFFLTIGGDGDARDPAIMDGLDYGPGVRAVSIE